MSVDSGFTPHSSLTRRALIQRALVSGASLATVAALAAPSRQASAGDIRSFRTLHDALPTDADEVQRFIFGATGDVLSFDPAQANDGESTTAHLLIHDSVAIIDAEFNVQPNLATSWEVSDDGLVYTYTFRDDVTFHDGSPLTADDVIFTIDRNLEGKYPEGRKKESIGMIDSYQKIDDQTVEITLQFPYAPFAAAFGTQLIVPRAVVESKGDESFGQEPVGCGPFRFVEWKPNDRVVLEGFEDYWLTRPNLTEVVFRPLSENAVATANLLAGDIDGINRIAGPSLRQLESSSNVEVLSEPGYNYFWAGFRTLEAPFTDLRFRKAVYHATDFDGAIAALFPPELGQRAYGTLPPGLWPTDDGLADIALQQDQDLSKALIKELVDEGVMPEDYTVVLAPPPDDSRIKIAEIMATNLQEVGLKAELFRVDWAAYTDQVELADRNLIFFLGTTPAIPDPDANLRWLFGLESVHGINLNIEIHPEATEWNEQLTIAQRSADQDERAEIYRTLQRTMMEQIIHIPLYHSNSVVARNSYVKDFKPARMSMGIDLVDPWTNVYTSGR